jgi:hypothetical protein
MLSGVAPAPAPTATRRRVIQCEPARIGEVGENIYPRIGIGQVLTIGATEVDEHLDEAMPRLRPTARLVDRVHGLHGRVRTSAHRLFCLAHRRTAQQNSPTTFGLLEPGTPLMTPNPVSWL